MKKPTSGSAMTVTQTTNRAVINWDTFSLQNGSLNFSQPGSSSITVNRVSASGGASNVNGPMTANGNVIILNPNGVLFGPNAQINVAGLIASTGDINPASNFAEFMAGGAFGITGATAASIANQGAITVSGAGLAAFVAPSVSNSGTITATSGRITLASAQAATISLNGGLYELAVTQGVAGGSISNTGKLSAAGGAIVITALDAANLVSGVINLAGIQQASRIEVDGGQVSLKSDLNAATVAGSSGTVDVCNCGQIQDGIDIAANGATVNVADGTYVQGKTLAVNKSITLAGESQAGTIIDTRGVTSSGGGYGMLVNADNVTLRDFTLYGPTVDAASAYGIKVQPAGSAASSRLNNFSILRVTSRGAGRAELDLNGVNGATIDQVTANGAPVGNDTGTATTKGAGIQLTDSANVTIKNSTTRNNAWGGVALFQTNRFFDQQTSNVSVQSNNVLTEALPLYTQLESTTQTFGALDLQGFNYAVRNSSSTNGNSQYTWMQYTLGGAFDLAVNVADSAQSYIQGWNTSATNGNFYVGVGHPLSGGTQAMSIMKAVDTSAVGNTINIAPGSYTETATNRTIPGTGGTYNLGLFINKDNLTLRGIDAGGNAITSADQVQAWITAGTATNFGMNHGVSANNVTIEGLGFKPYVANANKTIEIAGDNFTFRNSVVDNRSVSGGAGALYFGELDPTGHPMNRLNVTGSIFYDGSVTLTNGVGANGTTYDPASDRVISNNTFVGSSNYTFGGVLLNGQMAEIPWRTMPIGAATITGNRFSGFTDSVLVRGDQQGVDLRQVMSNNSFDRSVLVTDSAGNARGEIYQSTPDGVHFTPRLKYSIQSSLQDGVNRASSGDTVAVGGGSYAENVSVNKPLNFVFGGSTVQSIVFNANTGIAGNATASGTGFTFNAPVTLTGATSLMTMGGNIAFNGDIQNVGTSPFALGLSTGMGDIMMLSGGSSANPIGFFSVGANDFTLSGTLWVTGFNVGASGNIALSEHSLHATTPGGTNILIASGSVTGATFSQSVVVVNAGGDVQLIMDVPTGSSVSSGGTASVQNVGTGVIAVNDVPQPNTQTMSVGASRIIPPDNALPRQSNAPAVPPQGGGGREIQVGAESAGDALDQGFAVEIDLTPGPKKRK